MAVLKNWLNIAPNNSKKMAAHPFILRDLEAIVARWLQQDRCPPAAQEIRTKFFTDLDTALTMQTCQGLLLANLHHIKPHYVHRTDSTRNGETL